MNKFQLRTIKKDIFIICVNNGKSVLSNIDELMEIYDGLASGVYKRFNVRLFTIASEVRDFYQRYDFLTIKEVGIGWYITPKA